MEQYVPLFEEFTSGITHKDDGTSIVRTGSEYSREMYMRDRLKAKLNRPLKNALPHPTELGAIEQPGHGGEMGWKFPDGVFIYDDDAKPHYVGNAYEQKPEPETNN